MTWKLLTGLALLSLGPMGHDAAGQAVDTLETGRLTVDQVLHRVGVDSYTITREGDGYLLRAAFVSRFRGAVTVRSATVRLGPDLSPRSFRLRVADEAEVAETAVEVENGRATVTAPSGSARVIGLDRFFTASGVGPHAVQMMLVRYWLQSGRPDSIRILPTGHATVSYLGREMLLAGGESTVLDRYHIDGTLWGGQTLWLDGAGRLVAAVTFAEGYRAVPAPLDSRSPQSARGYRQRPHVRHCHSLAERRFQALKTTTRPVT